MAFSVYVFVDVFTFAYFYPLNKIMFETASLPAIETLKNVLTEWRTMNWLRSFIMFAGLVFLFWLCIKFILQNNTSLKIICGLTYFKNKKPFDPVSFVLSTNVSCATWIWQGDIQIISTKSLISFCSSVTRSY